MRLKVQHVGRPGVCVTIIASIFSSCAINAAVAEFKDESSIHNQEIDRGITRELWERIEYLEREMKVLRSELEGKTFTLDLALREVKSHIVNFPDPINGVQNTSNLKIISAVIGETSLQKAELSGQNIVEVSTALAGAKEERALLEDGSFFFDPDTLYRKGMDSFKVGNYQEAVEAYSSFIKNYPGDMREGSATYRLGEVYYELRLFQKAVLQYERLIKNFPEDPIKPHAMLKLAYCHYELGDPEAALALLEKIKIFFPGSKASELSEQRLKRLMFESP